MLFHDTLSPDEECTDMDVKEEGGKAMVPTTVAMESLTDLSDVTDAQLAQAALTAVTSGTLTPLIKVELRSAIQAKRLSEGKEEIEVQIEEPRTEELTEEEIERRMRRRERNKIAAQKCRIKRKEKADALHEESARLENINEELKQLVKGLEEERKKLREIITSHEPLCVFKSHQ